jgi:hypothetical protein
MLGYTALMLILPISALLAKASRIPMDVFIARATEPVALSAYYVSFSMAIVAGLINAFFGFILAWVLVKFDFKGEHQGAAGQWRAYMSSWLHSGHTAVSRGEAHIDSWGLHCILFTCHPLVASMRDCVWLGL